MKLENIRKLIDKATPGPWILTVAHDREKADECCDPIYSITADALKPTKKNGWTGPTLLVELLTYYPTAPKRVDDARFIAAARTLMPKLLAVAEAANRLTDNIAEFDTVTDSCFIERVDDALAALEADE